MLHRLRPQEFTEMTPLHNSGLFQSRSLLRDIGKIVFVDLQLSGARNVVVSHNA